jgi:eukaryotic-like serine/threonine-protein kinase
MAGIICPQCKANNKENARFCAECGSELGTARSSRSTPTPNGESTPGSPPVTGSESKTRKPPATDQNPAAEPAPAAERVLQNRYRIEEQLGRGGFGAVYRAWDVNLSRLCAVKENLAITPEAQRQFMREATLLANLSHSNLPRVIDHFIIPREGQYLVMDFIDGEDLVSILAKKEIIPVDQAIDWVTQVCGALEYLHGQTPPVLHRDIKPANIRITPKGQAVLVDFGLVKVYDQHLKTTIGARAITPGYAPPEQYGQGKTDERTDIYALGATLYNLVTGRDPLESVARMAGEHQETAYRLNPQVPLIVSDVIERALALEPAMRFQSAKEFQTALKTAQSIAARAPEAKNLVTMLVEPEGEAEATLAPAMSAPVGGAESISRPASGPRPPSRPPSAPALKAPTAGQPVAGGQHGAVAKPKAKRNWLIIGIGGVVILALCIGASALLASLAFQDAGQSENATLTYEAGLRQSVQETTTKLAGASTPQVIIQPSNTVAIKPTATTQARQKTTTSQPKKTATVPAKELATQQALQSYLANLEAGSGLVYGPKSGRIAHKAENAYIETINASVGLRSFILEVTFLVPYPTAEAPWDFGIVFREAGANIEYRLLFNSDKSWVFSLHSGSPDGKDLLTGTIADLNTDEGSPNKIRLYADGNRGWFFVNDRFISELDLSKQYSGAIMVGIGFHKGTELTGKLTEYEDFSIWSIP